MRIDAIMVITGLGEDDLERRRAALEAFASPGTEVRLVVTPHGPTSVESIAELELAGPGILQRVVEAERDGADAVVIWGGHDPSLDAARELVNIPVVGPGMASIYYAAALARRFSLLVQLPNVLVVGERQVRDLGLQERCASVRSVNVPVLELARPESYPVMRAAALAAIDADGADAVCFGCMAMTPHADLLTEELAELRPGALVINPGRAAIRLAESLVGMGLTHSRRSFPSPPKAVKFE